MSRIIQLITKDPDDLTEWCGIESRKIKLFLESLGICSDYESIEEIGVRWVIPTDKLDIVVCALRLRGIQVEVLDD